MHNARNKVAKGAKQLGKDMLKPLTTTVEMLGTVFQNFGNAQIAGDSGVGTAMATASGYQHNLKTGKWEQNEKNLKNTEELRDNLSVISSFSPTNPATVIIDKVAVPVVSYITSKYISPIFKNALNKIPKRTTYTEILPNGKEVKHVQYIRPKTSTQTLELKETQPGVFGTRSFKSLPEEYVTLYHGSPEPFNISNFQDGVDMGLHATTNKNFAKMFGNSVYEFQVPKSSIRHQRIPDLGITDYRIVTNNAKIGNGVQLFPGNNFSDLRDLAYKGDAWQVIQHYKNGMYTPYINNSGPKLDITTRKAFDNFVTTNNTKLGLNPEATINFRNIYFKDIPVQMSEQIDNLVTSGRANNTSIRNAIKKKYPVLQYNNTNDVYQDPSVLNTSYIILDNEMIKNPKLLDN